MLRLDKEIVKKKVRVIGLEKLDKALKQNKGVIALSCHIGNWEMGGVIIGLMGYDISAVVLTHTHKAINEFFIRQREERGLKVISMNSVMKRCISALSRNGILALAADRDFTNSGIELDFFGVPTSIPKGPATLSLKIGSPIVPCFLIREDRFNYRLIFEEPIEIKKRQGIEDKEIIREATRNLVSIMERYITSYPEQWLVFRRFWEAPENAFVL
jgi:KDO2-lipid IV(A) lauroyltransferase